MKLNEIEWQQACCGESYAYAEVETAAGWLRIKKLDEDHYKVTQFDKAGQLLSPEESMTAAQLTALL